MMKKLFILCCVILLLASVSVVTASDNATQDLENVLEMEESPSISQNHVENNSNSQVSVDAREMPTETDKSDLLATVENDDESELKESSNNELLTSSYVYNFADLKSAVATGGDIYIWADITITEQLVLKKNTVISSAISTVTLTPSSSNIRCFDVQEGTHTFSRINFDGFKAPLYGPAINQGPDAGEIIVKNCKFINCESTYTGEMDGGGAICGRSNSKLTVQYSTFENCKSARRGAAISNVKGQIEVTNCNFYNCQSNNGGAAIANVGSTLTISNIKVDDCVGSNAVWSMAATTITGSTFSDFKPITTNDAGRAAVRIENKLTISDSIFSNNAYDIFNTAGSYSNVLTISNCDFSNTNAYYYGQNDNEYASVECKGAAIYITDSNFEDLKLRAVSSDYPINIDNCVFENNVCNKFFINVIDYNDKISCINSKFINNKLTGEDGGIFRSSWFDLQSNIFLNNYAKTKGVICFIQRQNDASHNSYISNNIFINNTAGGSYSSTEVNSLFYYYSGNPGNVDYNTNWWGNDVNNKANKLINVQYGSITQWLYFTYDSFSSPVYGTPTYITCCLKQYVPSSSSSGDYVGASNLPKVKFSASASKGQTQVSELSNGKFTITYTPNDVGRDTIKVTLSTFTFSIVISNINKASAPSLGSAGSSNYIYGDSINSGQVIVYNGQFTKTGSVSLAGTATVSWSGKATGSQSVNVDANGNWELKVSTTKFVPGSYNFNVKYESNDYYNAGSAVGTVIGVAVNKANVQGITVYSANYEHGARGNQNIYYGKFTKYGNAGLVGTASVYRDGNLVKSDVSVDANGNFEYSVSSSSLDVGAYTYTIVYNSNSYYNKYPSSGTIGSKTVTVLKGTPQITFSTLTLTEDTYPGKVNVVFLVKNLNGEVLSNIPLTPGGTKFICGSQGTGSDGKATFTVTPLDAGTYNDWTVTSTETLNYKSATSLAANEFTIKKQVPTVSYVMFNTSDVYKGDITVSITLTDNNGVFLENFTVAFTGNDFNITNKTDATGSVSFTRNNLEAGTYSDWKFTVGETSNFDTKTVNMPDFTIKPFKVGVSISDVTPLVSIYKSVVTLEGVVIYPEGFPTPKGKVYAQLGDIISSGVVNNGTFTIKFEGIKPGYYYNVTNVYFQPDSAEKNYATAPSETLDIKRVIVYQSDSFIEDIKILDQSLNVITNLTYGTRITINGKVTGNGRAPTGNVSLYVDGNLNKAYARDEVGSDGEFYLVVKNAPAGLNHYFTVVYEGDEYYYESNNNSYLFNVTPDEINFENDKIQVNSGVYNGTGNSAYFNVVVSANGEGDMPRGQIRVNLSDNSRSWTANLDGGNATIYISNLAVGTYSGVTVEYVPAGDEFNYNPKVNSNTYSFEITKGLPDFTIEAPGVGLGEDAFIYINLPSDAKGTVTLQVRGNTYIFDLTTNPTNRTLKLTEPSAGAYKITASYSGDDNWKGHEDGLDDFNTTLYVERPGANVYINVSDVSYGEDAVINFTIHSKRGFESKARGTITVYGLGKENGFEVEILNGKGTLTVSDLAMGTYDIVAYYSGYNDLMGNINVSSFKVNGKDTKMTLTLNSSTMNVDDKVLFTVTVESDIDDPIYLYIDGERSGVAVAENGVAEFTISGLATGSHIIAASLPANEKYNAANNNTTLIVNKIRPDYTVEVVADSNKNIIFNIIVGGDASGIVTIVGNGTNKKTLVDEGFGEYTLTGLAPGVYTYNVTYGGDDNYEGFSVLRTVNSNKISDYPMTITNTETASGKAFTVFISVPSQLNGKTIHLYVNNGASPLDSSVVDGIATFTIGSTVTSAYSSINLTAVYDGDENYETKTVNKTIVIDKISEYDFNINIPDLIYVGDDVTVTVTCPDDISKINITVNGVNKGEFDPITGMILSDIDEGSYNLLVSYSGDNIYYAKQSNVTFSAIKRTPSLNVSVNNIIYGNPVIISINLTDETTGLLFVNLDGKEYKYINITNHKIIIKDSDIAVGNHNLTVSYAGDRIYNSAISDVYNFSVSKNSTVKFNASVNEVKINNGGSITRNDEDAFLFEVGLPSDATGNVKVTIKKGTSIVADKIIKLPNNMLNIPIKEFGTYQVTLVYSGDDNYESSMISFDLISTSNKVITNFTFDTSKTGTLYANVTNNVLYVISTNYDGSVELYIDGAYYNNMTIKDHAGYITLPNLASGSHLFTLNYNGDENHNPLNVEKKFNIVKKSTNAKIDVKEGLVSELTNITLSIVDSTDKIIDDASGYIFVDINGETQLLEVKNGRAVLNITYLTDGERNINVEYRGDSRYNASAKSTSFTINKFQASINVDEDSVMFNGTITIRLNYTDATGKIEIQMGNILKNLTLINGTAILDELPNVNGTYTINVNYKGDWKYSSNSYAKTVVVNKVSGVIVSLPDNITLNDDLVIRVGDDLTKGKLNVTFDGGESITVNVVNGTAIISADKLPQVVGDHTIDLNYYNGSYWDNKKVIGNIYFNKIANYYFNMMSSPIRFGENSTLYVYLPDDVNANLTVKINDVDYTVKVIDGRGVLENISGLDVGVNTVESEFSNDRYDYSIASCNIQVDSNDMNLTIVIPDNQLYVDDSAVINVKANVSMSNNVTVYVNGKAQSLKLNNGEGSFTIDKLVYGNYIFTAIFDGNENYTYTVASEKSFFVDKNRPMLNITTSDVIVGHSVNIKVNIDGDATGLVIVKVDDNEYTLNVTNNEYSLIVSALGNGTHNVVVKYYGDNKYYSDENTTSFEVIKLAPSIDVNSTILIGDDLTISIANSSSIVANPTGKLTFTIGDTPVVVDVVNGVAIIKANDLPQVNDTYTATVEYSGDNNYDSLTESVSFTIEKVPRLDITVPRNVTIDDEMTISVGDETTDGKLNVTIANGIMFTVDVVKGKAVIPVKYLPQKSNNYNISLKYYGGSYWDDVEYNASFHADKITDYTFTITKPVIKFGENATLEINLPIDVNTVLTVTINDADKTVEIINGYGKLENISGLHANENTVTSTFGSDKYETVTQTSTIQVNPNDITLTVILPVEQLYVDQSATIKVLANVSMNNDVIVYINGERNRTLKLDNGEASFTIPKLVYGKYVFTAVFEGNENYTQKTSDAKSFNVDKNNITLNVTADNIIVGHDGEVKVGIDGDATGLVIVRVDDSEYALNVTNDEYTLTVSGLSNGTHNIVVKYYGDSKYYGGENTTSFEVIKLAPSIHVSSKILIGEDLTFSITNSSSIVANPTGKLTFTIGDTPVVVDVVNGVAIIKANDLPQVDGTYTATVEYTGDNNYDSLTESVSFAIEKVPRLVITVPSNVTIDDEMTISVGDETTDGKLNVTIGNGEMFTVDVVNGKAVIPVKQLPQKSNTYAISLDYYAGSYWNDTSVVRSFHADKITVYPFVISNDTIKFDGVSTIRFTLPGDVNTNLTVLIDNIVKTVKITDGNGVLSIGNLHSGVNMVSTTFGNEKYETTSANGFIRVLANDITLNITVPDGQLFVDGEAVITVQANVTMNNTVIVYVNGEARSLKLNEGKVNFTVAPLVYGKYVFTAIFEGNENYTRANADMKTFNVEKITPTFNVDVGDILVDEDALIQVTGLPEDATGIVLIDINGTPYSLKINKGRGNLTVSGLKYGKYDVVANFTGDNKYYSNISTTSFNVDKNVIGEIKVSSGRIKDNKTQVTVTVAALDATGYVIIEVNNLTFAAKLLDGKTQIEVTNLTMGENLFNATYVGDGKYLSNMTNGVIVVDGIFIESGVNVTVDDIMVDGKAKFSISVFDDATGYVLLEVDGNGIRLPIFDAKAEFSLGNFKAGSYNVTVTYLGDDKYYTSSNSTTFNVFKYANDITVEVEDGVAGTPITIEVIGDNADATGDVTITVDGVNYTAAMKDGAAIFNVTVEKAGEFEVVARYSGNDYYNGSIANNSFTLDSAAVALNITAEDIVIGEDAVIIVKLADDATGNVTLSLKTTGNIYSSPIVDGVARFTIPDLKAGTYYITADYAGDIKYAPVTDDTASFNVAKKNTTNMISFNVNTDDNGTNVTVNVPENATGNITITMGDKEISAPVVDGVAVINLGNLTGDKNVTISYTGDDVYAGFSESAVISTKSAKLNSRITIEVTDINVGENANIIVHVPEDATGNVILSVDGKNYTSAIANAKAAFSIGDLGNGTQAIIAYFQGDEKYLKSENKSAITVNKLTPNIIVSADDITVGEATNIVVEVPYDATGTVEITIGDEKYTATVSQGKAVFAVKGLANGTYAVSASYMGDAKYLTNSTVASFNVAKNSVDPVGDNKSSIKVETKDNKTIVTVDLPEDATGYVNITIDNETYNNVPVVNGTASIPVNNVSENANISVAYSGDDKYDGFNQNATATDEGVKLNAQVIVKLDKASYAAGEKVNIIVAAPGDATGKLNVKVNGEVIAEVEGTDIIEYVVPAGGEFNIEVSYSGDKKYAPVTNNITFTAEKTNSTTSISVDDTTFDENATVTVTVPADAKGNVTITVGDVEYTANVTDGKAVFTLPKLGIGKYSIKAVYKGDDKYESSSADEEFSSDLKVVTENIIWGENATVSVISPSGTQGMLTVVCEKATFVVEITDTVMNFTFTGLLPGKHEVSVVYDRIADGYQVTVKKEINVARLASDMSVSVDDVIVGNDVVLHVTVNSTGDVNGSMVSVTINGKDYNATIVNGTADIRISGLSVGKYENINVTFMGTQFVAPSVENVTFNVNVLPVNLVGGKNINVFYLEGAQYSIRVMDMNGKPLSGIRVTFKVAGKTYNVVSDANGYAKVKLNLNPGSYKITASANGKSVSNKIKVKSIITAKKTTKVKKKAKKTIIKITVKGHKVKQSSKVKFTYKGKNKVKVKFGKDMKKQKVTVKFKGKTYKVKVNGKGVGKLKLAKKVAKKLRKGKKYSLKVTFKGPKLYKKVKVTVKFNGKKYKVKTNKAGVAKFKVTKKMVKKFKKGKKVKYTITYKKDTLKRFVKIK